MTADHALRCIIAQHRKALQAFVDSKPDARRLADAALQQPVPGPLIDGGEG